jgi:hypothetical protein
LGDATIGINIMNHFDGSPGGIKEYAGLHGTGKLMKPRDVVQGVEKLQLQAGCHS